MITRSHDNSISRRPAFTLVELLVTITILTLLASIVLFGMAGVQAQARDRRARAQILRVHNIIAEVWQTYDARRVQVQPGLVGDPRLLRLAGLRELMRMELPERISDVWDNPVVLRDLPTLNKSYRNIVVTNRNAGNLWTRKHQGAECLYMVLSKIYIADSNGLQFFSENEIGDVDNDGMPEILDPWGNPVEFLRWAPGFTSPVETAGGFSALQGDNPLDDWDAFDPMHMDGDPNNPLALVRKENFDLFDGASGNDSLNSNFALFPLIFSAGADGDYNVAAEVDRAPVRYSGSNGSIVFDGAELGSQWTIPVSGYANDPYATFSVDSEMIRMGQVADKESRGHVDNISNHILEAP